MLPNDVLLEIFDFYADEGVDDKVKQSIEVWIRLAHVCRRWRSLVFQSPLRLNLRLVCTPKTPTRDLMDIWPPFPLIVRCFDDYYSARPLIEDNIIAALEHSDRVCQIQLTRPELGYFANSAAILDPFPELTVLRLSNLYRKADEGREPILPDSFLGGSAPRLESLHLDRVSFPGTTEASFVCISPCQSLPDFYSSFRVHSTRGDGHRSFCLDQPRLPLALLYLPTTSFYLNPTPASPPLVHALSSPVSPKSNSEERANIWR
jgi:hypothetical protein